jgi:hypothetical protein
MPWQYQQSTGDMTDPDGDPVATGYAGNGDGLNNPALQFTPNVGPLPQGSYTIGPPHQPVDHMGPLALPLWPDPATVMQGRFGFFIHGDTPAMDHTASDGCIVLEHDARAQIDASPDKALIVVA